MAPKEPTRAQLSSRLTYSQTTPAFLRRLQSKVAGTADDDDDDEFEYDGSGRPPIPKRPAIPQRPDDIPGSADEDDADEAPQVVVLKEGKHLSQWEVEDEKRKAKGLPPLPRPSSPSLASAPGLSQPKLQKEISKADKKSSLSFSTSGSAAPSKRSKRKAKDDADEGTDDGTSRKLPSRPEAKKKQKKTPKIGLSFADDAA